MKHQPAGFTGLLRCLILGLILAGLTIPAGYIGVSHAQTFKRVKVNRNQTGPRINIQIKPEESYYHKKPPVTVPSSKPPAKAEQKTADQYDWFWSDFVHDLAGASLTRMIDAERQLSKAPSKSGNLAPSFASMRKLANTYGTDILIASLDKKVSPALILAVIGVESAGRVDAVSSAGAVGLMQLIPATAKRFKVDDSTDPKQNIAGGVAYLDWLLKTFNYDPVLALAGYNAGENAVRKHQGVPPFPETRGYIPKVVAAWQVAKALCKTPPKYVTDGCVFDFHPKVSQQ